MHPSIALLIIVVLAIPAFIVALREPDWRSAFAWGLPASSVVPFLAIAVAGWGLEVPADDLTILGPQNFIGRVWIALRFAIPTGVAGVAAGVWVSELFDLHPSEY